MNKILNNSNNIDKNSSYATPFNVDLWGSKPKNYFTEYVKRVLSLPELVKNILMDLPTVDFIEDNLGLSSNLNPEQTTEITRIIRDVLLSDLFIGDMPQEISSRTRLPPDEARKLGNLIVSELFRPAIEDIKKAQAQKFSEKINRPVVAPSPQTPKMPEGPDLKISPDINRNNVVDLRNK